MTSFFKNEENKIYTFRKLSEKFKYRRKMDATKTKQKKLKTNKIKKSEAKFKTNIS